MAHSNVWTPEAGPALWHYTCSHGHDGIGPRGLIRPAADLAMRAVPWTGEWVWLTDLAYPNIEGLGLTSTILDCARWEHRYRIVNAPDARPWWQMARTLPDGLRHQIERVPQVMPAHWWVSPAAVHAVYDPLIGAFDARQPARPLRPHPAAEAP